MPPPTADRGTKTTSADRYYSPQEVNQLWRDAPERLPEPLLWQARAVFSHFKNTAAQCVAC